MALRIEKDHQRFRHIVKGKIREDLRKFLTRGELLGKEGKHLISIPVRGIDIPHFRYGDNSDGGVGQGEGQPGDEVDGDDGDTGPGGTEDGQHLERASALGRRASIGRWILAEAGRLWQSRRILLGGWAGLGHGSAHHP